MEFLTFVRVDRNTALFTNSEGAERKFKILTGREGPLYTALFENQSQLAFGFEIGRNEPHAQPSFSHHDAEHAVELLVERCETMGTVVYTTPGSMWECYST